MLTHEFDHQGKTPLPSTDNWLILIDGIARTTFDGSGNLTQVDAVAGNGIFPLLWRAGTGQETLP